MEELKNTLFYAPKNGYATLTEEQRALVERLIEELWEE